MLSKEGFQKNVEELIELAATRIPGDVRSALKSGLKKEEETLPKSQLNIILENIKVAREEGLPICQDTGIPVFFVRKGRELKLEFDLKKALEESVVNATDSVPLRPNIVDPLTRENSENNTGEKNPIVHYALEGGKNFEIELMLKGAGSENWSKLFMMNPTSTREDIIERIMKVLKDAGGQICPPSIIGVGIGGTADKATLMAKKALLRPLDEENPDEDLAELEEEIKDSANELGIGPMGLGGRTTALGTRIEKAGCHTASLPLAINFQCWAARRAKSTLSDGELKIEVPK